MFLKNRPTVRRAAGRKTMIRERGKKMKKRNVKRGILSLLLVALFLLGAAAAGAEETGTTRLTEETTVAAKTAETQEKTPAAEKKTGDLLLFKDAEKETSPLTILIPERARAAEENAAGILRDAIENMTGYRPEVLRPAAADYEATFYADGKHGHFISLSLTEQAFEKRGGFTLRADKNLRITAPDSRGLINGVYYFLKTCCGYGVYAADVTVSPVLTELKVPADLDFTYKPFFEYLDTDWVSPRDRTFALANGLNGTYSPLEAEDGGKVNYITFCHSLTNSIVPESELFESHPEYFALVDGERKATQLCLSSPAVVNRAIEDVLRLISEGYADNGNLNIISVTQDDNQDYCECENCAAIAERYGGQSGLMLWFVNQIADAVAHSAHPDVVVDTFAYQYTRHAPKGIVPKENVCVRLCSIECCFSHPLNDPGCGQNAAFMADLRDWAAISDRLYIWDYTTNYSHTLGLFPDFGVLQSNLQTFYENSVVGVYEEGNYYMSECNTEFGDLRAYLLSRLMLDPYCDYEACTKEFLDAYYGAAGGAIGDFLRLVGEHAGGHEARQEEGDGADAASAEKTHLPIGAEMRYTLHDVSKSLVQKADKLWGLAKEAASEDPDALARVERSEISWRYYKACNKLGEFKRGLFFTKWMNENKRLYNDILALGVTRYNEGKTMDELTFSAFSVPDEWDNNEGASTVIAVIAGVCVLLLAAATVVLCVKKKTYPPIAAAVAVAAAFALAFPIVRVFVAWKHILLYYVLLLLFSVCAVFPLWLGTVRLFMADTPNKKKAAAFGIMSAASFVLIAALVFVLNVIVYKEQGAVPACMYSNLLAAVIAAVGLLFNALSLLKRKNNGR